MDWNCLDTCYDLKQTQLRRVGQIDVEIQSLESDGTRYALDILEPGLFFPAE